MDKLNERLDYLIHDLKAYKGFKTSGRGRRRAVKSQLRWWMIKQQGMTVIRAPVVYHRLWEEVRGRNHEQYAAEASGQGWHTFQLIGSNDTHVQVKGKYKHLLHAQKFTQTLTDTEHLIPQRARRMHECGTTSCHWGLWEDDAPEPRMTSEYIRALPDSQQWIEANSDLFGHLTDALRLLEPRMYVRYTSIRRFLPPDVIPICGAWDTCVITQNITGDGTAHLDLNDYHCGLRVLTGWGSFTSAKVVFWTLGLVIEIKPGDAIMFLGRSLAHITVDIQGGTQNTVEAFVHQASLSWKDATHMKRTGYGREGRGDEEWGGAKLKWLKEQKVERSDRKLRLRGERKKGGLAQDKELTGHEGRGGPGPVKEELEEVAMEDVEAIHTEAGRDIDGDESRPELLGYSVFKAESPTSGPLPHSLI